MTDATAFVMTHESDPSRTGRSLSVQALALTRSLGRRGVPVVRLHPNRLDASLSSRYCIRHEICPDMYRSEDDLLEFLDELAARSPERKVLLPASDDCALFLSRHSQRLSGSYALPCPDGAMMERIIDKRRQYEVAERMGVPIPETHFPADLQELQALLPGLRNYPYVIKPTVAHSWRLASMREISGGRKGVRADNAEQLLAAYRDLGEHARGVMLQEVIGGPDERLYTFLAYFDRASQPLGYCIRSKIRQRPIDFGYCTLTVTCDEPQVREQSLRLLQGLGYHGIVGVEWKHDPRTGLYKLIEINARAVNTIGIAAACGVDIPYMAFKDALGEPLPAVTSWKIGTKWIRLTQDIGAARSLQRQGRLSWRDWLRSLRGPLVEAVFARDDLRPFLIDNLAYVKRRTRAHTAWLRQAQQ